MAAEVLLSLVTSCHSGTGAVLPAELRKTISAVAPAIEKARLYRGRGGEVMRGAVCRMLEVLALVRMPCGAKAAMRNLTSVDESIKHPTEHISLAAVAALRAITRAYFSAAGEGETGCADQNAEAEETVLLVNRYTGPLATDPNAALRRGYALSIGALPAPQLGASIESAVEALVVASTPEPIAELRDPETRRNAVRALVEMSHTLGLRAYAAGGDGLPTHLYLRVMEAVLSAFDDYQMDNRGDVGSWVREAAMSAVLPLLRLALPPTSDTLGADSLSPPAHAVDSLLPPAHATAAFLSPPAPSAASLSPPVHAGRLALPHAPDIPAAASLSQPAGATASLFSHATASPSSPAPAAASLSPPTPAVVASLSPPVHAADDWVELRAALPDLCQRVACALCQQVTEKIDRVRELAATTLSELLREPLPRIHSHASLRRLFVYSTEPDCLAPADAADFLVPYACFPITVRLLSLPAYRRPALRGLSVSAGGMTESTLRGARAALSKHLANAEKRELKLVGEDLLSLLGEHRSEARLSLPLLRMTEQLLEARVLEPLLTPPHGDANTAASAPFVGRLYKAMRAAVSPSTKDIAAIMASLTMQVLLLAHARGSLLAELLRAVILLLGHRFPKVRKAAADQLYVHLLTYGDPTSAGSHRQEGEAAAVGSASRDGEAGEAEEGESAAVGGAGSHDEGTSPGEDEAGGVNGDYLNEETAPPEGEPGSAAERTSVAASGSDRLDECMRLLTETGWLAGLDEHAKPARTRMLELFGLRPPQVAAAAVARSNVQAQREDDSYAALVGEMGY
jgi:hypothetical protein